MSNHAMSNQANSYTDGSYGYPGGPASQGQPTQAATGPTLPAKPCWTSVTK
ncbi:hypothetical protein AHiyo8_54840 [Arthrobacter sp. Hiyo8]|nr:hypothetical protein AHiyo8_54840 [Arthrobacter sp. Hiyo8]